MNDPEETVHRFEDPRYAKVRKELDEIMRAPPGKILENLPEPIGMA